jgi:DNA polymerase-3 subunit alpha
MAARDLLEPGTSVIARIEADVDGEDIKLRLQGVESLEKAAANAVSGIQIFIRDEKPVESIAKRLQTGGRAPVRVTLIEGSGREITLSLGDKFLVTPQIRGALKAVQGVVDVQEL